MELLQSIEHGPIPLVKEVQGMSLSFMLDLQGEKSNDEKPS
jgi:hypothetical protein